MTATAPSKAFAQTFDSRLKQYRELVRTAAEGTTEIDPEAAVKLAESLGKTAGDFQEDLERVAARQEADRRFREVPELEKRYKELNASITADAVEFDRVAAALAAKRVTQLAERAELEQKIQTRKHEHRAAFFNTPCPYEDIVSEYQTALEGRMRIIRRLEELTRSTYTLRGQIEHAEQLKAKNIDTPNLDLPRMERDLADNEQQMRRLENEKRDADADVERLERLEP